MRDIYNNIYPETSVVPGNYTASASGQIINLDHYDGADIVVTVGAITTCDADNTFSFSLEHGDESDLSDAAVVASGDLLGSFNDLVNKTTYISGEQHVGYIGTKQYVRAVVTVSGTVDADLGVLVVKGYPLNAPVN